jgi:hypothetical protein
MLLSILPAATMADDTSTLASAESAVLREVNRIRDNHGLAKLRMDVDVQDVAGQRSGSMKRLGYFAHTSPAGLDASDLLRNRRVGYRYWGEVIGWTRHMDLDQGGRWMVEWWMHSPTHRHLLLSRNFNYAGVGIVRDGSLTLWTIVFVNAPDRTAPVAGVIGRVATARVAGWLSPAAPTKARVAKANRTRPPTNAYTTIQWWGRDRKLAMRTSGLQSFTVQHKLKGGSWHTVLKGTKARQWSWRMRPGLHAFRIKARDRAGNVGEWQKPVWVTVS